MRLITVSLLAGYLLLFASILKQNYFLQINSQSCAIKRSSCTIEKVHPFLNSEVTLKSSWIEQRASLNLQYLKSLEPDRLLHNFRVNAGLPSSAKPLEGWESPKIGLRGHFVGHYLSALASVVENRQDTLLSKG